MKHYRGLDGATGKLAAVGQRAVRAWAVCNPGNTDVWACLFDTDKPPKRGARPLWAQFVPAQDSRHFDFGPDCYFRTTSGLAFGFSGNPESLTLLAGNVVSHTLSYEDAPLIVHPQQRGTTG